MRPREASRFHLVVLMAIVAATLFALSGVDPVKVTEYSIVLSAAALPLTYFPILVIANDPNYMGDDHTNGRFLNTRRHRVPRASSSLVSLATIPLMIITKGGAMTAGRVLHAASTSSTGSCATATACCAARSTTSSSPIPAKTDTVYVTAIVSGPGAHCRTGWTRRLGAWLGAHAARLAATATTAGAVPMAASAASGRPSTSSLDADEVATFAGERWTRDHIVGHIPGSRHDADE